jgi:hypothetical protein
LLRNESEVAAIRTSGDNRAMNYVPSPLVTAYYLLRQRGLAIRGWNELAERLEVRGASLAIVGNAGYLSELSQGERIDSHDLVLRMNNFRTAGFEPQVGRKLDLFLTTFHNDVDLSNPALGQARLIIASVPYNFAKSRRRGLQQRHAEFIVGGLRQMGRREVFVPGTEYFTAARQQIGRYPTTGAMALLLSLDVLLPACGSLFVTGFSFFEGRGHYFHDQPVTAANHDPARERQWLCERLAPHVASGRVRLDEQMAAQLTRT